MVPNSTSQSQYIRKHFKQLEDKLVTITNFTDTNFFRPLNNFCIKSEVLEILVVGRINVQKNIPCFLEAMSLLKKRGVKFLVKWYGNVRKGTEDYYNNILKLRDEFGLSNYVEFYSGISDIRGEYQKCDLFCLPSLYEGYPNVLCEAMSCGKPVIASNVCDNPMIIEDGENGYLFNPNNPEELAEKIEVYCTKKP